MHAEKYKCMLHSQGKKKKLTEILPSKYIHWTYKDFKPTVRNILKEVKETMDRELREKRKRVSQQI